MNDDILQEFLAESWENLSRLDNEIVTLEEESQNTELLASIFRTIHTMKSTCGIIGLTHLGGVAHATENVLVSMRNQVLTATPASISVVLEAIDEIKSLVQTLEATGEEPHRNNAALIVKLNMLSQGDAQATFGSRTVDAETPANIAITTQSDSRIPAVSDAAKQRVLEAVDNGNTNPLNAKLLQQSFEQLAPQADRLAKRFFEQLLNDYPQYKSLFAHTDFADQRQKFIQSLAIVVKSANRPETISRFLRDLGLRHVNYDINKEDYAPVNATLLAVLEEFAGTHWTEELQSAWEAAVTFIAEQMQSVIEQHNSPSGKPVARIDAA